jgi:hypothetical protein
VLGARLESLRVRAIGGPARHEDGFAVEALQPGAQHRSVALAQHAAGDVHDATRVDPEEVAIEREVVDRARAGTRPVP